MVRELKKVVPTAAMSGAAVLAALAVVGDIMGVYGGGIAFVATACTIYNCEFTVTRDVKELLTHAFDNARGSVRVGYEGDYGSGYAWWRNGRPA